MHIVTPDLASEGPGPADEIQRPGYAACHSEIRAASAALALTRNFEGGCVAPICMYARVCMCVCVSVSQAVR